ncbi:MAG: PAS domain S-box protein, partial [Chloroflexi bacterium]
AVIARQAFFKDGKFWGLVAMVLDMPPVISETGLDDRNNNLLFALRDGAGTVFFGDETLFENDPVTYIVDLPEGSWEMAAVPVAGWNVGKTNSYLFFQVGSLIVTLLLTALAYLVANRQVRLNTAVQQKTGELSQTLQKLQESELLYRSIVQDLPSLICSFLPGGIITFVNDAYCQYFEKKCEELIGQSFALLIHENDRVHAMSNIASLTVDAPNDTLEHRAVLPGGEIRWQRWTNRGFFDENGQIVFYQSFGQDITDQKNSELALQESEARYRNIFQTTAVSIWEEDFTEVKSAIDAVKAEGVVDFAAYLDTHPEFVTNAVELVKVLDVNEATLKMYKAQNKEEFIHALDRLFLPETLTAFKEELIAIAEGKPHFETETGIQTLAGNRFEILLKMHIPTTKEEFNHVLVSMMDITKLKKAEAAHKMTKVALEESEERYRLLVEMSPDGIVLHRDDKVIYANDTMARLVGAEHPDELIGRPIESFVHPDHWEETLERAKRMKAGEQGLYPAEDVYVRLDGTAVPVEVTVVSLTYQGETAVQVIVRDISQRKITTAELAQYHEQLERLVTDRTRELEKRVTDFEQLNNGMLNLLMDLQLASEQVSRTAKQLEETNEELESFAYSVSHDLRAPLRHISGFVTMLQKREGERLDEKSTHYLQVINGAALRMGQLIDDLLTFSRTSRKDLFTQPVDVNNLVAEAQRELSADIENRTIIWQKETLPMITADPSLLRQVWTNLIENAVKYTSHCEEARIEIGAFPPDENNETTFFVRDNGVGFDAKYIDKLFGVFQRLHRDDEFEGTGIGLAIVRRIIHRHNGRTWAEGELDKGATFYFTIPNETNLTR